MEKMGVSWGRLLGNVGIDGGYPQDKLFRASFVQNPADTGATQKAL
jgi:hypothetical protein